MYFIKFFLWAAAYNAMVFMFAYTSLGIINLIIAIYCVLAALEIAYEDNIE